MYGYQLFTGFYQDAYLQEIAFMDTNQLVYLAPFFIIILGIVYLVRVKIFDRIYGLEDIGELEETDVSVFSNISDRDRKEIKSFREEDEAQNEEMILEDYYRKL
ncbi:hypothetical protein RM553_14315 [Zunongwangia sp. F363]|uniref:Uncharacterized protein n=1 Tax=Autumnicola tepida TaxID=3075595 RepID=A0ABU3CCE6_9FLAO|nr:hypothetical protein [Zunongwangia sp. F363]MDT0644009.1 hypothetical protein [Zunongwangia sp. F363]